MKIFIFVLLLVLLYVNSTVKAVPFYDDDEYFDSDDDYDEGDDEEEHRNRRYSPLSDFLGVPETCIIGRRRYACQLAVVCWMKGDEPADGCDSLLYRCCVPKRVKTAALPARLKRPRPRPAPPPPPPVPVASTIDDDAPSSPVLSSNLLSTFVNDPQCGIVRGPFLERFGAQRRIVGGDDAGYGHFPWQALVRIGTSRCGGSLVNRIFVVTAGHCVARAKPPQVHVTLGDYELKSDAEPFPSESYRVLDIQVHPRFQFTPQADRFDVAVLRLDRPVEYKPHITPICLPRKDEGFEGAVGFVAGWGATEPGSKLRPSALQVVDVPIISNGLCEAWHKDKGIGVRIFPEMICAGYRGGGKDSCQGDSGGPLMVNRFGVWYLVGLVSAGFSCAQQNQPGIYHRIAYTVDWIASHVKG